jgi:glycosyltransferase involved in cell wall biosynthesis
VDVYERLVTRFAASIFAVSEEDRRRFLGRGVPARKLQVVPNGVDPEALRPDPEEGAAVRAQLGLHPGSRMLLFFGQLDYAPNRQAVDIVLRELAPRLTATIIVAGKGSAPPFRRGDRNAQIRFIGSVPAMRPWINAADAVIVPVTSGGGTRLKILEAIACGTPVVSTSIGAEGIDRSVCGDLLSVVDGWDAFAAIAATVMANEPRRVPPGFVERYSWESIVHAIRWR